jgi:uncharacterized membrane protein
MNRLLYFSVFALSAFWCISLISFPWLLQAGHFNLAAIVSLLGSIICHQDPSRSFHVMNVPLPVCSRCTAIYVGSLLGVLLFPLIRDLTALAISTSYLLILPSLALGLDVVLDFLGIWNNTFISRSVSGACVGLGYSVAFLVLTHRGPQLQGHTSK